MNKEDKKLIENFNKLMNDAFYNPLLDVLDKTYDIALERAEKESGKKLSLIRKFNNESFNKKNKRFWGMK
jgi:hypothetical protein